MVKVWSAMKDMGLTDILLDASIFLYFSISLLTIKILKIKIWLKTTRKHI